MAKKTKPFDLLALAKKADAIIRSSAAEYLTFATIRKFLIVQNERNRQRIYDDAELTEEATIRNFRIVQTEGNREVERDMKHYGLHAGITT